MTIETRSPQRILSPYGAWRSPITAASLGASSTPLSEPSLREGLLTWLEGRPREGGRVVVMRRGEDGTASERTPPDLNVRTRAHSYGGAACLVLPGGALIVSSFADGRLHRVGAEAASPASAIVPSGPFRYADGAHDAHRARAIYVREEARSEGRAPLDALVAIDLAGQAAPRVLATGHDFFAAPRVSPDGSCLAYLTWHHPHMPWDASDLWVAPIEPDGALGPPRHVAGGARESIVQPVWSPDGVLHFVSDRTGFWNLYRARGADLEPLLPMEADFGVPPWTFGGSMYAFASATRLVAAYQKDGAGHLVTLDTHTLEPTPLATPYDVIAGGIAAEGDRAVFLGANRETPRSLVAIDLASGHAAIVARSSTAAIDAATLSRAEAVSFPARSGGRAFGYFYAPKSVDHVAQEDERPPLLVFSHGGPTARVDPELNPSLQYWTSRGFAVLDVNYGGSSGHGRAYRDRLNGRWGEVDVDDCIAGAAYLVARGDVDGARLAIRGGSAGGYTTLAALAFRDVFRAGASYYGIGDLELLDRDAVATNKFESHYNRSLIGPYPERRDLYVARSPLHSAARIASPVIFFQGEDDEVVPPNQSRLMFEALRAKGLLTAYLEFEGEGHGFRKASTLERAIEAELYFYARVFGLTRTEGANGVVLENDRR